MKDYCRPSVYLALIHYPVVDKNKNIVCSAVTNLDLHDISRSAKTYGIKRFYVVTPLSDQQELVKKIISHWTGGEGAKYNFLRKEALELIYISDSLESTIRSIKILDDGDLKTVATCAKKFDENISFLKFKEMANKGGSYLIIFGTAWGLADSVINSADYILEPIMGNAQYNHLSVRSAAAVILDRVFGFY